MKKLILFALCLIILSSCTNTEPDFSDSVIFCTDASGASVTVPVAPKNVAVLFSSFADIWLLAGGEVSITVYESVERGFADENAVLVDGGAGKSIDTERLIASSPDLVICSADIEAQVEVASLCNDVGIPALLIRVETFEDYLDTLSLFTKITEKSENYIAYGENVKKEVDALTKEQYGDTILFIRAGSSARSTKAKTASDHFAAQMLKTLGTHNIAEDAPILLDGISFEEVILQDPTHIFITVMGDENAAREYITSVLDTPEWSALSAVQNGNVHFLPKDMFQYKPNARWGEAYKYLTEILKAK